MQGALNFFKQLFKEHVQFSVSCKHRSFVLRVTYCYQVTINCYCFPQGPSLHDFRDSVPVRKMEGFY